MNIDFGVGLKNYLFENTNDQNISNIESRIISQVRKYMNFLEIIDVSVSRDSTLENNLKVNVFYYVDVLDLEASLEISV